MAGRRRTPGLRREEVAARAAVSITWYTWLEQGRGGPPSEEVLERLARALELDSAGRELLFLLAQQRPPPVQSLPAGHTPPAVSPALQRVLDGQRYPALIKTPTWDVVAWNRAATIVLTDYALLPPQARNVLRRLFGDPALRGHLPDWEANARFALGVFRVDTARFGALEAGAALSAELWASSAEFRRLWSEQPVHHHGSGLKRFRHAQLGAIDLEYSAFAVDGTEGLSMISFCPTNERDRNAMDTLLSAAPMNP